MAVILFMWLLGFIVLVIAWGGIEWITVPMKAFVQSLQPLARSRRLEIIGASLLALAVFSIMSTVTDHGVQNWDEWVSLPTLLVWAGGLWLMPFRLDVVGHYWPLSVAIAVILVLCWVGSIVHSGTNTHTPTQVEHMDTSIQQRSEMPAGGTGGLGFLFWTLLIGLTIAVIARYTSTWNAAVLNS